VNRTFAIRIDARKYDTVARLSRQRGATFSDAVREALDAWIESVRSDGRRLPYVVMADLVGTVDSATAPRRAARPPRASRAVRRGRR
jgi:hypothetical protein